MDLYKRREELIDKIADKEQEIAEIQQSIKELESELEALEEQIAQDKRQSCDDSLWEAWRDRNYIDFFSRLVR